MYFNGNHIYLETIFSLTALSIVLSFFKLRLIMSFYHFSLLIDNEAPGRKYNEIIYPDCLVIKCF